MERKLTIWATVAVIIIFGVLCYFTPKEEVYKFDTKDQISFGSKSAKVKVIVFEEFACEQCKKFHNDVLEPLFDQYVDHNKVQLVLIPLAYQDASYPAFSAACCIGKISSLHMRSFVDHIFNLKKKDFTSLTSRELTASYAMKQNRFPFHDVINCIQAKEFDQIREERSNLASSLYKDDLHFPTVLINGKKLAFPDKQSVFNTIERELMR